LLGGHPAGRRISEQLDIVLPGGRIDPDDLDRLIREQGITQVIEVADVDTLAFSRVCAKHGADHVTATIQTGEEDTMPAVKRVFEAVTAEQGSQLLGSGMNPGVVNALVLAGMDELAKRAGTKPDLHAIYITEQDTTRRSAGPAPSDDVFEITWSPIHALGELLEDRASYFSGGEHRCFDHQPHRALYSVRCGADEVAAMLTPHEEVVTLGTRFAPVECAFLYAIPKQAADALRAHPDRDAEEWKTKKLYHPHEIDLAGHDRVGVLLCSRQHGELWIGFHNDQRDGARWGTNATELQAASGILAGWSCLGQKQGLHVVEDLDWRAYLRVVESVLGAVQVHYDHAARPRWLEQRRLRADAREAAKAAS
jgi:homospermidine synthase